MCVASPQVKKYRTVSHMILCAESGQKHLQNVLIYFWWASCTLQVSHKKIRKIKNVNMAPDLWILYMCFKPFFTICYIILWEGLQLLVSLNHYQGCCLAVTQKTQGKQERSFECAWYDSFPWLEYFKNVDACFCYACRVFAKDSVKEKTFTETGFSNWKMATETGKGLNKHQNPEVHVRVIACWRESQHRENRGQMVKNCFQHNEVFGC